MRNWDDLRVFLAVARAGRLAPAARALAIDVTTVGRRLARLEASTGARLFETVAGRRRLTEAGEALLHHAEAIDTAMLTATPPDRGIAGHVRLSLAEGLATHVVAAHLAAFHAAHPALRLDLVTASGFLDPSKREADIAIMLARPRNPTLRATPMGRYGLGLYATADYLARRGTPNDAAALTDHTLIGYIPEHVAAPELDYLPDIHDGLSATLRSSSINVQHAMARAGAGIAILPAFIAARDERLHQILPSTTLARDFWLVTHADRHAVPRIQTVSAWLRGLAPMIEDAAASAGQVVGDAVESDRLIPWNMGAIAARKGM